ncbi:MAG: motility protein A [Clostridium sp.]
MKKLDKLTPLGLVIGIGLVLYAMLMGGNMMIFWDLASVFITVGGSFCAVLISYSLVDIKKIPKLVSESFKDSEISSKDIINKFSELSKKARREGLLSLEEEIAQVDDDFLKKGLQMVIDGIEPETIKDILELEISEMEDRHLKNAGIFSTWGAFAPAFGMIGTLIGLIQMMQNLTDVNSIAKGMGIALLTTFYGTLLANLFCMPVANDLKRKSSVEVGIREMMLEGILSIQSGVNPRIVEEKLLTYLQPTVRLEYRNSVSELNEGAM